MSITARGIIGAEISHSEGVFLSLSGLLELEHGAWGNPNFESLWAFGEPKERKKGCLGTSTVFSKCQIRLARFGLSSNFKFA